MVEERISELEGRSIETNLKNGEENRLMKKSSELRSI